MSKPDEIGAIVTVGGCKYMICGREDVWHEMYTNKHGKRQVAHEITLTIQNMTHERQWHTPKADAGTIKPTSKRKIKRKTAPYERKHGKAVRG